jgi:phosphoglycolate phosphatase
MSHDLRIILWDIDGTLVRSRRNGFFKDYTTPVLLRVFGTAGRLHELGVSGMTDLQIVSEALRDEGFTAEQVRGRAAELVPLYLEELERLTGNEEIFYALPGARAALEALEREPRYLNSLLTGNVEPAARLKLRLVGLDDLFSLPGAFGEDSHDRRDLPAVARERISRHLGVDLKPEQLVVIGDTPNDIACARHFGARAVAVATGRSYTAADLLAHKPDAILSDLTDTGLLLKTLAAL